MLPCSFRDRLCTCYHLLQCLNIYTNALQGNALAPGGNAVPCFEHFQISRRCRCAILADTLRLTGEHAHFVCTASHGTIWTKLASQSKPFQAANGCRQATNRPPTFATALAPQLARKHRGKTSQLTRQSTLLRTCGQTPTAHTDAEPVPNRAAACWQSQHATPACGRCL